MSDLKNAVVIGAGGNLGTFVTQKLVQAGFHIKVITRPESCLTAESQSYPSEIQVHKCIFDEDNLTAAFHGQDAVIVMIGKGAGILSQKMIVDAAVRAGVRRFIPSEFGSDTLDVQVIKNVPVQEDKATILAYLRGTAEQHLTFKWTGICNGAFLDWGLENSFLGFDINRKTANIYGSGNKLFRATTRATVGAAIVSALGLRTTENRYLYIADVTISQRELLSELELQTSSTWKVLEKDLVLERADGMAKLARKDFSGVGPLILADLYEDCGGLLEETDLDNGLLSIDATPLRDIVRKAIRGSP